MRSFAGVWLSGVVLSAAIVSSALGLVGVEQEPEAQVVSSIEATTSGVLEVHVIDHRGAPVEVWVTGCRDGVFPAARVRLETGRSCTVRARRRDGALWTPWTTPVTATTGHLAVDLPDYTMAGLGVRVSSSHQGARVDGIELGSAGLRVGLEPGDVIRRADGVLLAGRSVGEMVMAITGAAGTAVELEIIDVHTGQVVVRTGYRTRVN
jgi:hypothetical protein